MRNIVYTLISIVLVGVMVAGIVPSGKRNSNPLTSTSKFSDLNISTNGTWTSETLIVTGPATIAKTLQAERLVSTKKSTLDSCTVTTDLLADKISATTSLSTAAFVATGTSALRGSITGNTTNGGINFLSAIKIPRGKVGTLDTFYVNGGTYIATSGIFLIDSLGGDTLKLRLGTAWISVAP